MRGDSRRSRQYVLAALIIAFSAPLSACANDVNLPSLATDNVQDSRAAQLVDKVASQFPDSGQFDVFAYVMDAPFQRTFMASVETLKNEDDPIDQADSDSGFILTARTVHGIAGFEWYQRLVVAMEPIGDVRTKLAIKVFRYHGVDIAEDVSRVSLEPDTNEWQQRSAATFVRNLTKTLAFSPQGTAK